MSTRRLAVVVVTGFAVVLLLVSSTSHPAGAQVTAAALSGRVTSAADGPLAGVLVSARKAGSTVTVTVVSDEQGRYRFPPSKLTPGKHALTIRAAGYELSAPVEVSSSIVRFAMSEIVGAVFTALTVRTNASLAVRVPSLTVTVIVAVPV